MNKRGQFHLLELGIGMVLLLGLILVMPAPNGEETKITEEKIRLCHDLAGIWTYPAAGEIGELLNVMGIEDRVHIEERMGNGPWEEDTSKNRYACTATRIHFGVVQRIRIQIE